MFLVSSAIACYLCITDKYDRMINMTKLPTLAIIILDYNEAEYIEKCLLSAIDQTVPADEIIVVDNNSTDNSVAIVKRIAKENPAANIRVVSEKQQGMIPARNRGLNSAKSEVLGRIDADSTLDRDWVSVVKETFRDKTVAAATGPMIYNDMPLKKAGLRVDHMMRSLVHKTGKYKFLFGSNMAIRRSAWKKIKDKTYFALAHEDICHEDVDVSLCLAEEDLKIVYNPKMVGGMSARRLEDSPKDYAAYNRKMSNAFKHHGLKTSSAIIPMTIIGAIYPPLKLLRSVYKRTQRGD